MIGMVRNKVAAALLIGASAVSGCSASRLDHLGREPSFSTLERDPQPVPRNPSLQQQDAAPIDQKNYGGLQRASLRHLSEMPEANPHRATPGGISTGSLWSSDPHSLFGDRRAKKVGDILTVVIDIDDQAEISNATSRQRSGQEDMSATAVFGLESLAAKLIPGENGLDPALATSASSTATGQGQVSRNEAISLKVAARVLEVLPNGQLLITGRQEVRVNFELRDLQVMGLIRPEDITRNNDISYDKMAEARISYGGRGHISDMQQARYGQQVLDMISPF